VNAEPKRTIPCRISRGSSCIDNKSPLLLKVGLSIICFALLTSGCGKVGGPKTNVPRLRTNQGGLVSIGVLNTVDTQRQKAIMRYFASNGVAGFIEGSVMFDVLVKQTDVEHVRAMLETNPPPEAAFRSAWQSR
jgi:hypothetical protein